LREKREARHHVEDLGVDGRIILKRIGRKLYGKAWIRLFWLRMGLGGSYECADES